MELAPELWEPLMHSLKKEVLMMERENFNSIALKVFYYQSQFNPVYATYLRLLNCEPKTIGHIEQIPFLPIELFKNYTIQTGFSPIQLEFESSGTTGQTPSKHPVADISFYQKIAKRIFNEQFGDLNDYHIFALLPSYLERSNSSLVAMMDFFIKESSSNLSGFFLNQYEDLSHQLKIAIQTNRKIWLIGVTFGILDWIETQKDFSFLKQAIDRGQIIIMETGGMKGRREELTREQVHEIIKTRMGFDSVASEYGMTELFSQAYSKSNGLFEPGFSMKILLREVTDPFTLVDKPGKVGGIKVIDLGNIDSCSFIETKDLGSLNQNRNDFKVLGRFDNSEQRGCNLMVAQGWGTNQEEPSS